MDNVIFLRHPTMNDALDILEWRNDPFTRSMSRNENIIDRKDHIKWFERILSDKNSVFFMAELGNAKAGIIRFDHIGNDLWEVSINIKPDMRNRKIGSYLLYYGILELSKIRDISKIVADVKNINKPSLRIFEKCGFKITASDAAFSQLEIRKFYSYRIVENSSSRHF